MVGVRNRFSTSLSVATIFSYTNVFIKILPIFQNSRITSYYKIEVLILKPYALQGLFPYCILKFFFFYFVHAAL